MNYDEPDLLFLRGTFFSDVETLQEPLEPLDFQPSEQYDNILKFAVFKNIETWAKKTNLHCHGCTMTFDTVPIAVPTEIKAPVERSNSFIGDIHCTGVFCSFACDCFELIYFNPFVHSCAVRGCSVLFSFDGYRRPSSFVCTFLGGGGEARTKHVLH